MPGELPETLARSHRSRNLADDARRALVLNDCPLVADLIELTLNHGLFVVRTVTSLDDAERVLGEWSPHIAIIDMDHDDSLALLRRLGASNTLKPSGTPILGLTRRGDLPTKLGRSISASTTS